MKTEDLHRHVCFISGKGMSEGFLMNDKTYEKQEDFVKELRKLIPEFNSDINAGLDEGYFGEDALDGNLISITISDEDLLEYSYEVENHLWTDWYQNDLEDEGEGYDDEGNLYEFKDKKWVRRENPTHRVWAKVSTLCYVDVYADDNEIAIEIASNIDGGDFITVDGGSFNIIDVEEIK